MSPHHQFEPGSKSSLLLTLPLLIAAAWYLRGWIHLRSTSASSVPAWRASSFFVGLFLVWTASGSPLASYDHDLLTVHMIQHLLLMTFAPALLLMSEPLKAFWDTMPLFAQRTFKAALGRPLVYRLGRIVTNPTLCWIVSALTLIVWHIPTLFTIAMRSRIWHTVELAMFFGAGVLFWWPVVQPWPSVRTSPRWSILVYLFLATLPCDILSGFLVFSDRVAYPVYFSAPRMFGFSVLEDQQCAAALMWTCVTLVYLLPAAIISTKLLAPRASHESQSVDLQFSGSVLSPNDSKSAGVL